jgi:hypothetical protein
VDLACAGVADGGDRRAEDRVKDYVFFRPEGFYVVRLLDDADARRNAECNPGTYHVETMDGETVWVAPLETAQ